jgi:hypothetical protein
MAEVGRELEREQRVVELQGLAHVGTRRELRIEFEKAAVIVAQAEFARRAQHAMALDTAQLAHLDIKRLAIGAAR